MNKWGFKLKPYDICVANKTITRRQCTIIWHVYDLKISHVDSNVVDDIIELLDKKYGQDQENPMTAHLRKTHDYLGITINYNTQGNVVFTMFDYIQDVLDKYPKEFHRRAETPAANHLLRVNKESEKLNKEDGSLFHHLVAKVMYPSKKARTYIQTDVFLCAYICSSQIIMIGRSYSKP